MPSVSVLIVSYRTPRLTLAATRSALALPDVREVVVVDNASQDETAERLTGLGDDRVLLVQNDRNVGFGAAMNVAAARATGDILLFLNSDALITTEAAAAMVREVERHAGRCIAAPRLIGEDGEVQRSAGLLPRPSDLIVRSLGMHRLAGRLRVVPGLSWFIAGTRLAREYALATTSTQPVSTSMVSGAVCAVGRSAFHEIGGFDERFFLYFEDADLCRRAGEAGMSIRYLPHVEVPHVGGASSSDDYHFGPHHARSMRQYLAKWYGAPGSMLAVTLMFLRVVGTTFTDLPRARRAWSAFLATLGAGAHA